MSDGPFHLATRDGRIVCGATSTRTWSYGSQWEFSDAGEVLLQSAGLLRRRTRVCQECVRMAEDERARRPRSGPYSGGS